jgi:hypothetical protein
MTKIDHRPVTAQAMPGDLIGEILVYPWMTPDGHPVLADGSVEGCSCETCETRRREAERFWTEAQDI